MKASEANLLKFLQKPAQFVIPIYQRPYSWNLNQCNQLWKDVLSANEVNVKGHFLGSVVYIEKGIYQVTAMPLLLVIDGQQRLTTVSLLLAALSRALRASSNEDNIKAADKINNYYLFNDMESKEDRYKLLLTRTDKDTFTAVIENRRLPENHSVNVVTNFAFFEDQIKNSKLSLLEIANCLHKLLIVDIALDHQNDNPQLIFESLNSTGLDLSQADLIRNFVLMSLPREEQERIYNDLWYPMERRFGDSGYVELFDRFMRDYLTVETGNIPNIREVYGTFKQYVSNQTGKRTLQQIIENVFLFSGYFVKLVFAREEDKEINEIIKDINSLKVEVAYPFLLELYFDYDHGHLPRAEFIEILKIVENYVFRRSICGIPTNSMNSTFATIGKEIGRTTNYLENVKIAFMIKDSYRRFPDSEEFKREFMVKDVYNLRNRNYLLRKLENNDRKEPVIVEEYTIEHIMPQNENLSPEWKATLGTDWERVHKEYLHTIGNLTLTGYNSELSDRPFLEKQKMKGGFADSPIRLNHYLATTDTWNESKIKHRAEQLADLAVKIWDMPKVDEEILKKEKVEKKSGKRDRVYGIDVHAQYLKGDLLNVFQELRKRILNLDASAQEEIKRRYIAYKVDGSNFVDVIPQRKKLLLSLKLAANVINDPNGVCRDVSEVGRWGNGITEAPVSSLNDIDYAMGLVKQSFEGQRQLETE
jgi:uncharacterized protein with ParB-like and HNH nuclease domain/predicted transport protein